MEYQYVKLPDGSFAKFSAEKDPEEIKSILTEKGLIGNAPEKQEKEPTQPSILDSAREKVLAGLHGLQDSVFLGADDEVNAGLQWIKGKLTGNDVSYQEEQAKFSNEKKALQKDNPYAYGTGQGLSLFTGAGAMKAVPSIAEGMAKAPVATSALLGGVSGYNSGDTTEERLTNSAIGAGVGGVLAKLGGNPKVGNHREEMVDRRLLSKAKRKLRGTDIDPSRVADADQTMNSVVAKNNADIDSLFKQAKAKGIPEKDVAELKGIVTAAKRKTAFTNPEERERARELLGKDAGDYLADLLDENALVFKKYPSRVGMLPDDFGGALADSGTTRVGAGTLMHNATKLPVLRQIARQLEKRNTLNKGLKKLEPISDEVMDRYRGKGLSAVSKANSAKEKLAAVNTFKGFDIDNPDELVRYAKTVEKPRLDKLSVVPDGLEGKGIGLSGAMYRENAVDPESLAKAAIEVADEQNIPLHKAWGIFSGESDKTNLKFVTAVRKKLQDMGAWADSSGVKTKRRKAFSKRSTMKLRQDLKG